MFWPSSLRLLKVQWLHPLKHHLIQLNILWSFAWSRKLLNMSPQSLLSLLLQPHFQWVLPHLPPLHPCPQSATPDTDFSALSQPTSGFASQDPSSHPTFLPESCLYFNIHFKFYLLTSPTCFLQVTVFNPIWHQQGRKNKGRGWVNNSSLAKGLRGQVCPELKLKLFLFLQSLSCCPTQSIQ